MRRNWKLSWSVAEEIRALVKQGVAQKDLAASYKVSKANIWMIVVGRIYKRPPRTPEERAATKKAKLLRRLAREYDTTPEAIEALGTTCHICGKESTGRWGTMHIDHIHGTKQIRGRLCITCNLGLGYFKDSIALLKKAIDYLERHGKKY